MNTFNRQETMQQHQRKYTMLRQFEDLVVQKSYVKIDPDFFEPYDRFVQMNQRVLKASMVKLINNAGEILILRPDVTTGLSRQIMPLWQDGMKIKMFYNTSVFKQSDKGRIEENRQFGVEYLGEGSDIADREIIGLAIEMLKQTGMDFVIEIGNTAFLQAIIDVIDIDDEQTKRLKNIVYHKNQHALDAFIVDTGIRDEHRDLLEMLFSLQGDLEVILKQLKQIALNGKMERILTEVSRLGKVISEEDLIERVRFDLAMVSRYDYYDGLTMQAYLKGVAMPVLSGGRYNPLTKQFGKDVPAIGFALDTTTVIKEVMRHEHNVFDSSFTNGSSR